MCKKIEDDSTSKGLRSLLQRLLLPKTFTIDNNNQQSKLFEFNLVKWLKENKASPPESRDLILSAFLLSRGVSDSGSKKTSISRGRFVLSYEILLSLQCSNSTKRGPLNSQNESSLLSVVGMALALMDRLEKSDSLSSSSKANSQRFSSIQEPLLSIPLMRGSRTTCTNLKSNSNRDRRLTLEESYSMSNCIYSVPNCLMGECPCQSHSLEACAGNNDLSSEELGDIISPSCSVSSSVDWPLNFSNDVRSRIVMVNEQKKSNDERTFSLSASWLDPAPSSQIFYHCSQPNESNDMLGKGSSKFWRTQLLPKTAKSTFEIYFRLIPFVYLAYIFLEDNQPVDVDILDERRECYYRTDNPSWFAASSLPKLSDCRRRQQSFSRNRFKNFIVPHQNQFPSILIPITNPKSNNNVPDYVGILRSTTIRKLLKPLYFLSSTSGDDTSRILLHTCQQSIYSKGSHIDVLKPTNNNNCHGCILSQLIIGPSESHMAIDNIDRDIKFNDIYSHIVESNCEAKRKYHQFSDLITNSNHLVNEILIALSYRIYVPFELWCLSLHDVLKQCLPEISQASYGLLSDLHR